MGHTVEMAHVITVRAVPLVQEIADHANLLHHQQPIAATDRVMVESHVPLAHGIVGHVHPLRQLHIVEMGHAITVKTAVLVQMIVQERIHATIVRLQTGKRRRGLNVVQTVGI